MQGLGSVPFIFLCALSDRDHIREGREIGAGDYLTKPLDIDELVTTVKENLKRERAISPTESAGTEVKLTFPTR